MANIVKRFVKEEEGQTYVEYGILIILIATALMITTVGPFGQDIHDYYQNITNLLGGILG